VGSLNGRVKRLEERVPSLLRDLEDEERQRRSRAITRWILDEARRLKDEESPAQAEGLLERSVRRVVEDQYADLGPESRQYIADGWTETLHSWTRLDWWTNAGRDRPPSF
jgi:hypothetical protein